MSEEVAVELMHEAPRVCYYRYCILMGIFFLFL
jgi:hypothetical protein